MFGLLRQKDGETIPAMYYTEYPKIRNASPGTRFFCKKETTVVSREFAVRNLEYIKRFVTISTTANIDFAPETYVLIHDRLYKIRSVSVDDLNQQAVPFTYALQKRSVLTLEQVDNPTGRTS